MGGGSIDVPGPTPQQTQLQTLQLSQAQQAAADTAATRPYVLSAYGLKQSTAADITPDMAAKAQSYRDQANQLYQAHGGASDPNIEAQIKDLESQAAQYEPGGLVKMTEDERLAGMTPVEQQQYQATKLQNQRLIDALQGNLPVDPALEKDLQLQQSQMEEQLARDLGPNWKNSTAGMQRIGEFTKRADLLRESARRGEINTGTGLALNQMGYLNQNANNSASQYQSVPNQSMGYANSYASQLAPYQTQQQMQYGANVAQQNNAQQQSSSTMSGLGTLAGFALGGPVGGMAGGKLTSMLTQPRYGGNS
jgi:hypothetical protein